MQLSLKGQRATETRQGRMEKKTKLERYYKLPNVKIKLIINVNDKIKNRKPEIAAGEFRGSGEKDHVCFKGRSFADKTFLHFKHLFLA